MAPPQTAAIRATGGQSRGRLPFLRSARRDVRSRGQFRCQTGVEGGGGGGGGGGADVRCPAAPTREAWCRSCTSYGLFRTRGAPGCAPALIGHRNLDGEREGRGRAGAGQGRAGQGQARWVGSGGGPLGPKRTKRQASAADVVVNLVERTSGVHRSDVPTVAGERLLLI